MDLDLQCINTIRFLAVDAVQKAKSGHPGLPLGAAPMAFVLWDRFMKFNPADPKWCDRDRFILSAGHGCALQYALLHLTGYDLSLEDLMNFRQWGSRTPGHPEYGMTPGVEATTGPLGQGIANAVGMAIAEEALAARYNRPDFNLIDHYTYVIASDGDLMEGVASEAASYAGHLRLGKLIVLHDNNHITIEGGTELTFTEDRLARFRAYGWQTLSVDDGNDVDAIDQALHAARAEKDRPTLINIFTHIGYGSPHKQDTAAAHGEPLGEEEVRLTKQALGWPTEPLFHVPEEVLVHCRKAVNRGRQWQEEWKARFEEYEEKFPDLAAEFLRVVSHNLPSGWEGDLSIFKLEQGPLATRSASGKIMNAIAPRFPELMGGAADLSPSTFTMIADSGDFEPGHRAGRNMHFGLREHGMGAILNGMSLHGGLMPFGSTFLIFSDYMRPPIRLAAMNRLPVIYIFTHDSIGLGEDGPTHQPVEQLLNLRSIPNLTVVRPADANETVAAWRFILEHRDRPVALILTRQKLPVLDPAGYPQIMEGLQQGGYILADSGGQALDMILIATGSEIHLALEARRRLIEEGIRVRVVSLPIWEVFREQPESYRELVIPPEIPALAIEAGVTLGWRSYLDRGVDVIGVDKFGASAPGETVIREYGLNVENLCKRAHRYLGKEEKKEWSQ